MAVKISLKKNERKKYQRMVFAIVGVFLFFFGSSFLVKPEVDAKSTKVGDEISSELRSITLIERQYYPKEETLIFSFTSPVNSSTVLDELKVSAKKDRTDKTKYDTSIKKINEDLYVVKVKHLPDTWEKLAVAIYAKKVDLESMGDDQKSILSEMKYLQMIHIIRIVRKSLMSYLQLNWKLIRPKKK